MRHTGGLCSYVRRLEQAGGGVGLRGGEEGARKHCQWPGLHARVYNFKSNMERMYRNVMGFVVAVLNLLCATLSAKPPFRYTNLSQMWKECTSYGRRSTVALVAVKWGGR